ncbi:MAG: recombinase family protein [Anaerolineae bacterium]
MSRRVTSKKANQTEQPVALCYVRQSFTRDANDTNSPERQRANIQAMCDRNGWQPEWYIDAEGHKSGRSEKNRPNWLALKARLGDPDVVALVANDLARLHRKAWHVGRTMEQLDEVGIRLVFAAPGREMDTSTPQGRMLLNFLAMQDEAYANDVSQRVQDSVLYRKRRGVTIGLPPFGTVRAEDGRLVPTAEGAWHMPDGSHVSGTEAQSPHPDAVWRSYYACAERILTAYAENLHGYNRVAKQLTQEGWCFRDRWGNPRLLNNNDVRRVTSNWREYAGIVTTGRAKERIAFKLDDPVSQLHDTGREVFNLELLRRVALAQEQRSHQTRQMGANRRSYDYALLKLVYCAHCEALAARENNPRRRSRLIGSFGDRPRYKHQEGLYCGAKRRSVDARNLENDFIQLVSLLTLKREALPAMAEMAIQSEHGTIIDADIAEQKKAAIAKHKRKIDAARYLFEEGDISRDEYLRRKQENEHMIAHWEIRTSEHQQKMLELSACLEAIDRIVRLWDHAVGDERLALAHGLFEHIVFDLDTGRIVDFRLHPWADHYLVLRADWNDPEGSDSGPENEETPEVGVSRDVARCDPSEIRAEGISSLKTGPFRAANGGNTGRSGASSIAA